VKLRAAVIGLGRVGSRFDEEVGRRSTWTHVGAYLSNPGKFELVGAVDPDNSARDAFSKRCPGVPSFSTIESLLSAIDFDVLSICTPVDTHESLLARTVNFASPKVIWCEKPFAPDPVTAKRMVECAAAKNIFLVVSHVRRWLPLWRRARAVIDSGLLGNIVCVRVAMPNRLYSMGSHQIDLALYLGGTAISAHGFHLRSLEEGGEPSAAGFLMLKDGAYAVLQVTGKRDNLMIEAEVIGVNGRMLVREDRSEISIEKFIVSEQYMNYRQLGREVIERMLGFKDISPFEMIAEEIYDLCTGRLDRPTCSGAEALDVQKIIASLESVEKK